MRATCFALNILFDLIILIVGKGYNLRSSQVVFRSAEMHILFK
jgi:hypothetical protein